MDIMNVASEQESELREENVKAIIMSMAVLEDKIRSGLGILERESFEQYVALWQCYVDAVESEAFAKGLRLAEKRMSKARSRK